MLSLTPLLSFGYKKQDLKKGESRMQKISTTAGILWREKSAASCAVNSWEFALSDTWFIPIVCRRLETDPRCSHFDANWVSLWINWVFFSFHILIYNLSRVILVSKLKRTSFASFTPFFCFQNLKKYKKVFQNYLIPPFWRIPLKNFKTRI